MDERKPSSRYKRTDNGLLVAVEGIDGAGKTTQCLMLRDWLHEQGVGCSMFHEPTHGPIGEELRRLARSGRLEPQQEFEYFRKDRIYDVETNIAPALARGEVVIMDRYYISSIAYQGALGLDAAEIQAANEAIAPRPDLIFLLDAPVRDALGRVIERDDAGPNLFEREEYQLEVQRRFALLDMPGICRINAARGISEVHEEMREIVPLPPYDFFGAPKREG
ncbi:dTMP kinase [bacterium]|nr:dTMP kinase [bacterium]